MKTMLMLLAFACLPVFAQTNYTISPVTGTGTDPGLPVFAQTNYTISPVTGTGPTTRFELNAKTLPIMLNFYVRVTGNLRCIYQIESSDDQSSWSPNILSEQTCPTASKYGVAESAHIGIPYVSHKYVRVNVLKYEPDTKASEGGDTPSLAFFFTPGPTMHSRWQKPKATEATKKQ